VEAPSPSANGGPQVLFGLAMDLSGCLRRREGLRIRLQFARCSRRPSNVLQQQQRPSAAPELGSTGACMGLGWAARSRRCEGLAGGREVRGTVDVGKSTWYCADIILVRTWMLYRKRKRLAQYDQMAKETDVITVTGPKESRWAHLHERKRFWSEREHISSVSPDLQRH